MCFWLLLFFFFFSRFVVDFENFCLFFLLVFIFFFVGDICMLKLFYCCLFQVPGGVVVACVDVVFRNIFDILISLFN